MCKLASRAEQAHITRHQAFYDNASVRVGVSPPVARDEDGYTSFSSGFSIDSCTKEEMNSFDKTEGYALAMSDAVISLPVFISFLKGHASLVERAGGTGSSEPRPFNARGFRLVYLSEDM
jgi:hypothetical protein